MRFAEELIKIFSFAAEEALRTGYSDVGPDHMLLALLRCRTGAASSILEKMGVNIDELKTLIDNYLQNTDGTRRDGVAYDEIDNLKVSRKGRNIMAIAATLATLEGTINCTGFHLLKAIVKERSSYGARCLNSIWDIDAERLESFSKNKIAGNEKTDPNFCVCIRVSECSGTDNFKS